MGKYFMERLLGVPEFMLVILYLIFNQVSNPIQVRTVATMCAALFGNAKGGSMNRVLIVLTVAGTLWLPNASALAESKSHKAGPPAGAGSSVTHGVFGSISQFRGISMPPAIPAAALIAVSAAPGLAGTAPGLSGGNPGHGGSAPGLSGGNPGHGGSARGQAGNSPEHSGDAPGQSGSASGSGGRTNGNDSPSDAGAKRVSLHLMPSCK